MLISELIAELSRYHASAKICICAGGAEWELESVAVDEDTLTRAEGFAEAGGPGPVEPEEVLFICEPT